MLRYCSHVMCVKHICCAVCSAAEFALWEMGNVSCTPVEQSGGPCWIDHVLAVVSLLIISNEQLPLSTKQGQSTS